MERHLLVKAYKEDGETAQEYNPREKADFRKEVERV